MAFKLPAHLHRNRYGVLYFRLAIPKDLKPLFGMRECWRSLGTSSVREASLTAQTLKASLQHLFCELRGAEAARLAHLVQSLPTMLETASLAGERVGSSLSGSAKSPSLAESIKRLPTPVGSAGVVTAPQGISPSVAPRLSETVDAYIRAKNVKDSWTPHTERANRAAFGLLREHFGDRPIDRFDTDDMI